MPREASKADLQLSAALAARGIDAPARGLERMRLSGLLAPGAQRGLGRGRGSVALRDADEVDRAELAHKLLAAHGSYERATLAMFVDGRYPVAKNRLETAYAEALAGVRRLVYKRGQGASDQRSLAEGAAAWMASRAVKSPALGAFRTRIKERPAAPGMSVRWSLESATIDLLLILLSGRPDSQQGLRELLTTASVSDLLIDPVTGAPSEPLDLTIFDWLLPRLSLANMENGVRETPVERLENSRDSLKSLRAFAAACGGLLRRGWGWRIAFPWLVMSKVSDIAIAYATPAMVWIADEFPQETTEFLELAATWTPRFSAQNFLVDQLPDNYRALMRPGAVDLLTPSRKAELDRLLDALRLAHPNEWKSATQVA
jgi:hypothetical protein